MWSPDDLAPADRALWDAMGAATPRFSTMPTPGAPNELAAFEAVATALGTPPLPWQRWAVRVMTEFRPGPTYGSHRYVYPDATVTVERQSGKTTFVRALLLMRGMIYPGRVAFYTAQTGKDARARWLDLVKRIESSELRLGVTVRRGIGAEALVVPSTGAEFSPFAPSPTSLHGYTPHDVAVDELFAFTAAQGMDLVGAIGPAQQTLPSRQSVWLSTAGSADSAFLRERVDTGRLAIEDERTPKCYLEWSLDPDADPYDEVNWKVHPALGHLISMDDLREFSNTITSEGEWRRAFWNQWVESSEPVYSVEQWRAAPAVVERPSLSDTVLGYAIDSERESAAVVAAWEQADGTQAVKVVWSSTEGGAAPDDLADVVLRLREEHRPRLVVADNGGLTRVPLDVVQRRAARGGWSKSSSALLPSDWVIASTGLVSKLTAREVAHDRDEVLDSAIPLALRRPMGEAWALSHKTPAPLLAAVAALRGLDTLRRAASPEIYMGGSDDGLY